MRSLLSILDWSVVNTLRGDDFLLRFVMLALKTGDIRRVAQGFATLAAQLAALGGARFGWAMRLASEAEVLARRSSDSATIGVARMCRAIVRYFAGEFDDAANDLTGAAKGTRRSAWWRAPSSCHDNESENAARPPVGVGLFARLVLVAKHADVVVFERSARHSASRRRQCETKPDSHGTSAGGEVEI